ncbi:MAG: tRNA (adenosine(37)-N6)-dimethylallyltransferase MiaA [Erythrobacter sp. 34-65-8]|nr:MAG: tRNA (adenosine(37)-N6)-dimethylallyltransferase MiaA [Erythrobacter sp. 34-65-8]
MSTACSPERNPVALIAGPTASGKSALAVALAQRLEQAGRRAVILNADSAQVYADLAVLSARPTPEEMGGIEHRLFGAWDGASACSAADWAAAAKREIGVLHTEGAVPVLVGGTGLYLRTLLDGIAPIPAIEPEVRTAVRALPVEQAYAALQTEDPERAERLAPADSQRIARALEVVRSTGRPLGEWQDRLEGGIASQIALHPLVLLPPREWLFARCDRRFAQMLEQGALAEVETLLARALDPALPVMRAIGVPEISALLKGEVSPEQALAAGQLATRQYAKRQYTWFRNQPPREWPRIELQNDSVERYFASLFHF